MSWVEKMARKRAKTNAKIGFTRPTTARLGAGGRLLNPDEMGSVFITYEATEESSEAVSSAILDASAEIPYEENPDMLGRVVKVSYPPGETTPHIIALEKNAAFDSFGNTPPKEQKRKQTENLVVQQISTLKTQLVDVDNPSLNLKINGVFAYHKPVTLEQTYYPDEIDTITKLQEEINALVPGEHQVVFTCVDRATNVPTYIVTPPQSATNPVGEDDARNEFSAVDLEDFDFLNNPTLSPSAVVYLYYGQVAFIEADILKQFDPRSFLVPPDAYLSVKHNWNASSDPGVGDDEEDGYSVTSRWYNTTSNKEWVCFNAAAGAAEWVQTTGSGGGGGAVGDYILIQDQKTQNTSGGTFTQGAWRTRDLNTVVVDDTGAVSLSSNQFTLPAGTYRVHIQCPAFAVNRHQARLQNITDASTTLVGSSQYAYVTGQVYNNSDIYGVFTIAGTKTFEVQHQCETTQATYGFGVEGNFSTEIYTTIELVKVA